MQNVNVLVLGGTGKLGGAIAEAIISSCENLLVTGRKRPDILAVAERLTPLNRKCEVCPIDFDMYSEPSMVRLIEYLDTHQIQLDAVVKAAGGNRGAAKLNPEEGFEALNGLACEDLIAENMRAQILIAKYLIPHLGKNPKSGAYVSIGSMAGLKPLTQVGAYSAVMAAEHNWVTWLAIESAKRYGKKVRCNVVAPGFVPTGQNLALMFEEDGTLRPRGSDIIHATPFAEFGTPADVVGAVKFLIDPELSGFITGVVLPVDGGFSAFSAV